MINASGRARQQTTYYVQLSEAGDGGMRVTKLMLNTSREGEEGGGGERGRGGASVHRAGHWDPWRATCGCCCAVDDVLQAPQPEGRGSKRDGRRRGHRRALSATSIVCMCRVVMVRSVQTTHHNFRPAPEGLHHSATILCGSLRRMRSGGPAQDVTLPRDSEWAEFAPERELKNLD